MIVDAQGQQWRALSKRGWLFLVAFVYKAKNLTEAAEAAGLAISQASKLQGHPEVLSHIKLEAERIKQKFELSSERITFMGIRGYEAAMSDKQYLAAKGFLELLMRKNGDLTERHEVTGKDGGPLEIAAVIVEEKLRRMVDVTVVAVDGGQGDDKPR